MCRGCRVKVYVIAHRIHFSVYECVSIMRVHVFLRVRDIDQVNISNCIDAYTSVCFCDCK